MQDDGGPQAPPLVHATPSSCGMTRVPLNRRLVLVWHDRMTIAGRERELHPGTRNENVWDLRPKTYATGLKPKTLQVLFIFYLMLEMLMMKCLVLKARVNLSSVWVVLVRSLV